MKNLENDFTYLEKRLTDLELPKDIYEFVYNNLTRYKDVMNFNLGFLSPSDVQALKQEDTDDFLPILCGVQKYFNEKKNYTTEFDVNCYVEGYR